jgi:hypothetical protein
MTYGCHADVRQSELTHPPVCLHYPTRYYSLTVLALMSQTSASDSATTPCVFCAIVRGDLPAFKVYEDEHVLAFLGKTNTRYATVYSVANGFTLGHRQTATYKRYIN